MVKSLSFYIYAGFFCLFWTFLSSFQCFIYFFRHFCSFFGRFVAYFGRFCRVFNVLVGFFFFTFMPSLTFLLSFQCFSHFFFTFMPFLCFCCLFWTFLWSFQCFSPFFLTFTGTQSWKFAEKYWLKCVWPMCYTKPFLYNVEWHKWSFCCLFWFCYFEFSMF